MLPNGTSRSGQVLEVMGSKAVVQVSPAWWEADGGPRLCPGALSPSSGDYRSWQDPAGLLSQFSQTTRPAVSQHTGI